MTPFFEALFERFTVLHGEIKNALNALPPEALDWKPGSDMNSVSVIITHLTGAERFLIGDVIMGESSNRNRDAEFQVAGLGKDELLKRITDTESYIRAIFERLSLADLETLRTHPRHGNQVTVAWVILHCLDHVGVHTGHIQITSQLWHQKSVGEA